MTTSTIQGWKAAQKLFQRSTSTPILLLSSQGENNSSVDETCRRAAFLLQQQLNLRTVVVPVVDAYVTDPKTTLELKHRVGAGIVAAVGSGRAVELAKAVVEAEDEGLVLLPATPTATLAAASNCALTLPQEQQQQKQQYQQEPEYLEALACAASQRTIVTLPSANNIDTRTALQACMAVALDGTLRGAGGKSETATAESRLLLDDCIDLLLTTSDNTREQEKQVKVAQVLMRAGKSLEYGLDGSTTRSLPVALAMSLIPPVFPQYSLLTFWASLAPSLWNMVMLDDDTTTGSATTTATTTIPDVLRDAPRTVCNESVETLIKHIHENQSMVNAYDLSDDILRQVLQQHVIVP